MTRQEKINKVSHFCAANDCPRCKVRYVCDARYTLKTWGKAEESTLDALIVKINEVSK